MAYQHNIAVPCPGHWPRSTGVIHFRVANENRTFSALICGSLPDINGCNSPMVTSKHITKISYVEG